MYSNFSSLSNPYGHHPYMLALQRHFDSSQEQYVSVVELGVDGESVISMTERLPTVLDSFNNIDTGNLAAVHSDRGAVDRSITATLLSNK
jgi:hypothetical protein